MTHRNPDPTCAPLRESVVAMRSTVDHARRLVEPLDDAQANWRPAPEQWSIAECLAHLNRTAALYVPILEKAIARGRNLSLHGAPPFRKGPWGGRLIVAGLGPNPPLGMRRLKAPGAFRPRKKTYRGHDVLGDYIALNETLMNLAREADGLALDRLRFGSPISGLVRMDAAQAFRIMELHQPRHLAQAQRVRDHTDFPAT